jgi:putative chitinase
MTPELLLRIIPLAGMRVTTFADPLGKAMAEFDVSTPQRQAAFLSQIAHESGSLRYMEEIADGSAYEGRLDLGNDTVGDGKRYKGRGVIQITGKSNYRMCGVALGMDFLSAPERLAEPISACRSAGWFWRSRQLNQYADKDQFGALTKKINGGFNGLDDRISHWLRIRKILGVA